MTNPYTGAKDFQFWRRAVSQMDLHALDPVVEPRFRIAPTDKVATAGSCFAQHISRHLSQIGFHYFVTETGENHTETERIRRNYGVFSARFGNVYTVRQMLQLFREAMGERKPTDTAWLREDGRYVDPFRPAIEPDGFETPEAVISARVDHLACVRRMFLEADILVFTLGLTEGWQHLASGDIMPLAPGVSGGTFDPSHHGPINFTVNQTMDDLSTFLQSLKHVNAKVKVVLTVSPVPLIATYEQQHVLVSTVYSKSVLRVAAGSAKQAFDWVDYFPSYELIGTHLSHGRYFKDDLREVNNAGVAHAMRCFLNNYAEQSRDSRWQEKQPSQQADLAPSEQVVICDEERIDPSRS